MNTTAHREGELFTLGWLHMSFCFHRKCMARDYEYANDS